MADSLRDSKIDLLSTKAIDFHQRQIKNAAEGPDDNDYVTLKQLKDAIDSINLNPSVTPGKAIAATVAALLLETNNVKNPLQTVLNLVQGTNIVISADGYGNVKISSSLSPVSFETNGTLNAIQNLLNLIAGSNITLTNTGGGVTISAASGSGATLETNGTLNGSQTLLNLVNGTNISITDDTHGNITIAATIPTDTDYYQTIENNGTPQTQRGKLNLIPGTNVTVSAADNAGADSTDITIAATAGGATLETNSVSNISQAILNLISGNHINISNPSAGNVNVATVPNPISQHVVTGSRAAGTVYQNTDANPRFVTITVSSTVAVRSGNFLVFQVLCDAASTPTTVVVQGSIPGIASIGFDAITFVVLPGYYYELVQVSTSTIGTVVINDWVEWGD